MLSFSSLIPLRSLFTSPISLYLSDLSLPLRSLFTSPISLYLSDLSLPLRSLFTSPISLYLSDLPSPDPRFSLSLSPSLYEVLLNYNAHTRPQKTRRLLSLVTFHMVLPYTIGSYHSSSIHYFDSQKKKNKRGQFSKLILSSSFTIVIATKPSISP